jgi:hypothetical protein
MANNAIVEQLSNPDSLAALIIRNNTYAVFERLLERGHTPQDATIQAVAKTIDSLSDRGMMNDVVYALSVPVQPFKLTGVPNPELYDQAVGAMTAKYMPKFSNKDGTNGSGGAGGGGGNSNSGSGFLDGLGDVIGDIDWSSIVDGIFGRGNNNNQNNNNQNNPSAEKPFDWTPIYLLAGGAAVLITLAIVLPPLLNKK